MSTRAELASRCDASLSTPISCPVAVADIGAGRRRAGDGPRTCDGTPPQRAGPNHVAAERGKPCRIAALGHSDGTTEAARDSDHRLRADTLLTTPSPVPPISGHGAPNVMKVNASDDTRSPESPELALRAFAISAGCPAYANAAPVAQISRSSPVNWICPGALHRSAAGSGDHRHRRGRQRDHVARRARGEPAPLEIRRDVASHGAHLDERAHQGLVLRLGAGVDRDGRGRR